MSQPPQWPPSMPDPSEPTTGYVPVPSAGSPYESYQPYQPSPPYPQPPQPYQYQYPPPVDYSAGYATAPGPIGTNGLAIAALILGLLGFCGIAAVIGLILGIVALAQIRRTGQSGAGMALAGVVLSALWLVAVIALTAYAVTQGINAANEAHTLTVSQPPVVRTTPSRRPTAPAVPATGQPVFIIRLNVGDCIVDYDESAPSLRVTVVPCTVAHRGETVGKFDLTGTAYPGDQAVAQQSQSGCTDRFKAYAPRSFNDSSLKLIVNRPTELSWRDNDKSVVCMVFDKTKTRTGSLKG